MINLLTLQDTLQREWQTHPRFRNRALGGRRALDGFTYQLAVSLERFFRTVLSGDLAGVVVAFEGLSDLADTRDGLTYLIQVKATLNPTHLRAAIAEAIAVDEFLEERFPTLRETFRYKVIARRITREVSDAPDTLSAEALKLHPAAAARWNVLRHQCLPVEVADAPIIALAILLWRDVKRPISLIDSCIGRLMSLLSENASPERVARNLLDLWQDARVDEKPPLHLLGAADLSASPAAHKGRIAHGVRPTFDDLNEGCFMRMPNRIEMVLSAIRRRWDEEPKRRLPAIPVFWIAGPSGAGKSVLLLQVAQDMITEGRAEAVNFVESYAHVLPRALESATHSLVPLIIVGDDLYSPSNRDAAIWRAIGEITTSQTFPSRLGILTCGPPEDLSAFRRECERHRGLDPIEIKIDHLNTTESSLYHAWYQARTGAEVPLSSEPVFIAAAWTYELCREQSMTPEDFALRFDSRLDALGLGQTGRAALALNLYGFYAPETLFANHRPEIAQLANEQIWRLAQRSALTGRFFHPQISRLIYDVLVPQHDTARRAEDIAVGFAAMLQEGEPAVVFLRWLDSGKIGKKRARSALSLDVSMRLEILRALWRCFEPYAASDTVAPLLFRWHRSVLNAGIDTHLSGIKSRIRAWWRAMDPGTSPWALLFQMVWDGASLSERLELVSEGRTWLARSFDTDAWPFIFTRIAESVPTDDALRAIGFRWLERHLMHRDWPRVWGALLAANEDPQPEREEERLTLRQCALRAIPVQPESEADVPVWERTALLDPPSDEFLNAMVHKLATVCSPHKLKLGVSVVLSHVPYGQLVSKLRALQDAMDDRAWPFLWLTLLTKRRDDRGLLPLGRDWLHGRDHRPEWAFVWQTLIDHHFQCNAVLPLGRDWLNGREAQPEWTFVWQTLIERRFECATLLPLGRDWLSGRDDQPEWTHVWRTLIKEGFERDVLLPLGRNWLKGRDSQPECTHVWEHLIRQRFERDTLLPLGRDWLDGRDSQPDWNFVWQLLVEEGFERNCLLSLGRSWLSGRDDQPGWNYIWQRLIEQSFELDTLLPLGREWLRERDDQPGWTHVWQKLVGRGFEGEDLLQLGRDWLKGRDRHPEWNFVWQQLIEQGFELDTLLPLGRGWLSGRESQPEWAYVWRKLIEQDFACSALLPLGLDWLNNRENHRAWTLVWEQLLERGFERSTLLPLGRDWLRGREDQSEWAFVWRTLMEQGFERDTLLRIGHLWLRTRGNQAGRALVANLVRAADSVGR